MKLGILAVTIMLIASCAPSQPYRPAPTPPAGPNTGSAPVEPMPGRVTNPAKPASNYSQDAVECERKAALSQAGGKGEAFAACMRGKGYTPGR